MFKHIAVWVAVHMGHVASCSILATGRATTAVSRARHCCEATIPDAAIPDAAIPDAAVARGTVHRPDFMLGQPRLAFHLPLGIEPKTQRVPATQPL
eukprot:5500616-Prymnesium_polylepis.1